MNHLERVRLEKEELLVKFMALQSFINIECGVYDSLGKNEKILLSQQLLVMGNYLDILDKRLSQDNKIG